MEEHLNQLADEFGEEIPHDVLDESEDDDYDDTDENVSGNDDVT